MLVMRFNVLGDDVLVRGLSRFGEAASDFTPVWPDIHNDFFTVEVQQFASEGWRSSAWQPLSPKYKAWKDKHFPGKRILELSGVTRLQMTSGLMVTMEPKRLTMDPGPGLASLHQHGYPPNNLPARRPVELTEDDKMRWVKMIQKYLVDAATKGGLR